MKLLELIVVFVVCGCSVGIPTPLYISVDGETETGYYWRDYSRDVPKDAYPAGMDKRGKTTYIGQTSHTSTLPAQPRVRLGFYYSRPFKRSFASASVINSTILVPGQIREAEQKMTYEWGYKEYVAVNDTKILCTHHPEQFEWIPTNKFDILNLTDKHLVIGGTEKNYSVYIGRVFLNDEVAVGKVLITNDPMMEGLYTTLNGKYLHIQSSFEVLAYNASAPLLSEKHVTMKLRPRAKSSTENDDNLQVEASYGVVDDNESIKPVTPKSKSDLGSPGSSGVNTVWSPLFVVVLLRTFQEFIKV